MQSKTAYEKLRSGVYSRWHHAFYYRVCIDMKMGRWHRVSGFGHKIQNGRIFFNTTKKTLKHRWEPAILPPYLSQCDRLNSFSYWIKKIIHVSMWWESQFSRKSEHVEDETVGQHNSTVKQNKNTNKHKLCASKRMFKMRIKWIETSINQVFKT